MEEDKAHSYHKQSVLPPSERVDVGNLLSIFSRTTNSYKYLFFLSVIKLIKTERDPVLCLDDICARMLAEAWHPVTLFKLSFGLQDMIPRIIEQLPPVPSRRTETDKIFEHYRQFGGSREFAALQRYVPTRLLRPFFSKNSSLPVSDTAFRDRIIELAGSRFDRDLPLYCFDAEMKHIVLHHHWLNYLLANIGVVEKWAMWEYLAYMQKNNPSVPNIMTKLYPQERRSGLQRQRSYWDEVLAADASLVCPYTGLPLKTGAYALDHIIPWAFVAHDRLWNLVPADPEANGRKSDRLPSRRFFSPISDLHLKAAVMMRRRKSRSRWEHLMEPYLLDLRLTGFDLFDDPPAFRKRYTEHLATLRELAALQGFSGTF